MRFFGVVKDVSGCYGKNNISISECLLVITEKNKVGN